MVASKRRYLLFEVLYPPKVRAAPEDELLRRIKEAFESHWGMLAEAQAYLRLLFWSPTVHLGLLRVGTPVAEKMRASLTLLQLKGAPVRVHFLSGTVEAARHRSAQLLLQLQQEAEQRATGMDARREVQQGFQMELQLLEEATKQTSAWR
ncbi:unnamed protein product [Effrenium voratum]|nr:unnamed protein product [Effrenium voratum]